MVVGCKHFQVVDQKIVQWRGWLGTAAKVVECFALMTEIQEKVVGFLA